MFEKTERLICLMNHSLKKQLSVLLFLVIGIWGIQREVIMAFISSSSSGASEFGASGLLEFCGANRPFPQNLTYPGCIKPNNVTQTDMNNSVESHYDHWKKTYVRQSNGVTPGGGYYVFMKGTGGSGDEITTSEAHGYGMIIFALMAGYDDQAKQYFDGMFNMFDKHRSKNNPNNMSWVIDSSELASKDQGSATDGDMDIAYAFMLAHFQWGSKGNINYLTQAQRIISDGIKNSAMGNR